MGITIIVRKSHSGYSKFGRTRSEQARNLQNEWGGSGMTDEQIDKCKYLERKSGMTEGFIPMKHIDSVK